MSERDTQVAKARITAPPARITKPGARTQDSAPDSHTLQRAVANPAGASPTSILRLQRTAGNRAVANLLAGGSVQAKLMVGPAHDSYEQEAERVSRQVVGNLNAGAGAAQRHAADEEQVEAQPLVRRTLQRHPWHAKDEEVQAKRETTAGAEGGQTSAQLEGDIQHARSGGRQLDPSLGRRMGRQFNADFSTVRVHADSKADVLNRSLQAKAFTVGQDVFFRSGQYNPHSSSGQQLVAHELTHVVQQNGNRVRRKPDIQRMSGERIQRVPKALKKAGRSIKEFFGFGRKEREGRLTQKHGVNIGGGGTGDSHFSHLMMDKIDKVLKSVPQSHFQNNPELTSGIRGTTGLDQEDKDDIGAASAYFPGMKAVVMNRPMSWMPWWLYTKLAPKHKTQRKQMDKGAMAGYKGIDQMRDQTLGLNTSERSVFAGVSKVAVKHGGLATQTMRHELGHAVDAKIKFTRSRASLPVFGGWRSYKDSDKLKTVSKTFLEKEGVADEESQAGRGFLINNFASIMSDAHERSIQSIDNYDADGAARAVSATLKKPEIKAPLIQKLLKVKRIVQIANSQPWTFSNGKTDELAIHGRVYQRDHYGRWASYLAAARANAVSNYQFSSPGEWFAEAYTSYYDPKKNSPARKRLNEPTRQWFEKNLGHYDQSKKGTLEDDTGKLEELLPFNTDQRGPVQDNEEEVLDVTDAELQQEILELLDYKEHTMDIGKNE